MRWHNTMRAGLSLLLFAALHAAGGARAAEIRYDDVLYLDELKRPPLTLKVLARAPLTFSRDPSSIIAHLARNQPVSVLGITEKHYYVHARIPTGPARGWLRRDMVESPAAELLEDLNRQRERMLHHRELIARREVALGMTRTEVHASLGRPDRRARTLTPEGQREEWTYIVYRYVPHYQHFHDAEGRLRQTVTYQKTPSGYRLIVFDGAEVIRIQEDTGPLSHSPPSN
jgi:hypothetical protein